MKFANPYPSSFIAPLDPSIQFIIPRLWNDVETAGTFSASATFILVEYRFAACSHTCRSAGFMGPSIRTGGYL